MKLYEVHRALGMKLEDDVEILPLLCHTRRRNDHSEFPIQESSSVSNVRITCIKAYKIVARRHDPCLMGSAETSRRWHAAQLVDQ